MLYLMLIDLFSQAELAVLEYVSLHDRNAPLNAAPHHG